MIECESASAQIADFEAENAILAAIDFEVENAVLAAIVDSSDDAIIGKTLDGIITTWNPGAHRIFEYTPQEAIGRPILMLLPRDRADEEQEILSKLRKGERVQHLETIRVAKSGREINVSLTSSPIRDRNGTIIGGSKIVRDITDQKRAAEAMRLQQSTMEHMARLNTMGEMAIGLAHELNQPLASILNYAGVSLKLVRSDQSCSPGITTAMQEVVNETLRAREIIRRMRDFITKRQPTCEPVCANDLVRDSVHLLNHELTLAKIDLRLLLTDDLPVVMADPVQVQQVLVNLIRNAHDAMLDPRAVRRELTIVTRCTQAEVTIDVTDGGCGLTEEQLSRLFSRFFTTKSTGLGMGLAISKTIMNALGGRLTGTRNRQGGGMTFQLALPVKPEGYQ